jgi:amphi-Trp domain-containing protein
LPGALIFPVYTKGWGGEQDISRMGLQAGSLQVRKKTERHHGGIHMARKNREMEKGYSRVQAAAKLERLARALEKGEPFRIQVGGERITIPADAVFTIEHDRRGKTEEVEFEFSWKRS